jgi:hypothetical protein
MTMRGDYKGTSPHEVEVITMWMSLTPVIQLLPEYVYTQDGPIMYVISDLT